MQRTKYGFLVPFDTQKRKKYSDKKRKEIARLKVLGLSTRKIAEKLDIPHGSIHYILKEFNLVNSEDKIQFITFILDNKFYCTKKVIIK